MDEANLSSEEVTALVLSILEAVEAAEAGMPVRDSWPTEMRDWIDLLLARLYDEGGNPNN